MADQPIDALHTALQTPSAFGRTAEPSLFNPFNVNMGQNGALLQMLMPQLLSGFMRQYGMQPSEFLPTQNYYDQLAAQTYHQQQQLAMTRASKQDLASLQRTLAGAVRMTTGQPLTREQQTQTFQMAADVQSFLPMLSMLLGPETADQLMGSRGSAMQMAQSLQRSLRTTRDPATGTFGVSGRSAGLMAEEIFSQLYGTEQRALEMQGISAGTAGRMFEELSTRGLLPTGADYLTPEQRLEDIGRRVFDEEQQRRMAEAMLTSRGKPINEDTIAFARGEIATTQKKIGQAFQSGDKLDLSALTDMAGTEEMLSTAEAARLSQKLKNMVGAVNAMRDIFGDAGRPNAPMRELINGLDALTQGGLASMSPGRVEQMVRMTRNLADSSGLGMQGIVGLTAQGAQLTDKLNLDRSLAVTATQSSTAFSSAFRDTTRGDLPAFGALDAEKAMLLDQQLRVQAQASTAGSVMGTMVRLEQEGFLQRDSEAAAAARALRAGSTTYEFGGKQQRVPVSEPQFRALMARSGVDAQFAQTMLEDRFGSQEYIRDFGLGDLAREMQVDVDLVPRIGRMFSAGIGRQATQGKALDFLRDRGLIRPGTEGAGDYTAFMRGVSRTAASKYMQLEPEVYKDKQKFKDAMSGIVEASIRQQVKDLGGSDADADELVKSMGGAEGMAQAGAASRAVLQQQIRNSPNWRGYQSEIGLLQMSGRATMQAQRARMVEAASVSEMQSAMAGLGRTPPLARLVDTLQRSPAGTPLGKMISEAFGGISEEALAGSKPYTSFKDAMELYRDAERYKYSSATADEVEEQVARGRGITRQALQTQMGGDPVQFRKANAAEFEKASKLVDQEHRARVGQLSARGVTQQRLSADIVRGLTDGQGAATDALERIAEHLGELPGLTGLTRRLADKDLSTAERSQLQRQRRDAITQAIDARLTESITPAEARELKALRSAVSGLRVTETGTNLRESLGFASDILVQPGDLRGIQELGEAAAKEVDPALQTDLHRRVLDAGKSTTDALLSSQADLTQLGAGGVDRVLKLQQQLQQIEQQAKDAGLSPAEFLSTKAAKPLRDAYLAGFKQLEEIKRSPYLPGRGERASDKPMTDAERSLAGKLSRLYAPDGAKGTAEELLHILTPSTSGKFRDSAALMQTLNDQINQGDRSVTLGQALAARGVLLELGAGQGLVKINRDTGELSVGEAAKGSDLDLKDAEDAAQLRRLTGEQQQAVTDSLLKRRASLNPDVRRDVDMLERQAKPLLDLGRGELSVGDLTRTIGQFSALERTKPGDIAKAGGSRTGHLTLNGTCRIVNSETLSLSGNVTGGDLEHNDMLTNILPMASQSV